MRVLVCGGRSYGDQRAVDGVLDGLRSRYGRLTVIQGGAKGADELARWWALRQSSVRLINEPADWAKYGPSAGPIRNQVMIDDHKPDLVIAFRGGRGTADMVDRARRAGIEVREI